MKQLRLKLTDPHGLHARPAAQFVQKAASFRCEVKLAAGGRSVNAKSILHVLSLGLAQGSEIVIEADGADEEECIAELRTLLAGVLGVEA
jgi:phosphotransferase system HPr (HPr) family protein